MSGGIRSPSAASASATLRDLAAADQDLGAADDDDHASRCGAFSAIDSGSCTALRARQRLDAAEFDSRKKIRIVKTSISETRFMSTIVWLRPLRSARLWLRGELHAPGRYCGLDDRRVADRDVGEVVGADDLARPAPGGRRAPRPSPAPACRTRCSVSASTVASSCCGNFSLISWISADERLGVGAGRAGSGCGGSIRRPPSLSLTSTSFGRTTTSSLSGLSASSFCDLLVRLRRQAEVDHRQVREHRHRQQERHQHHDQVDERGDLQLSRRLLQAAYGHGQLSGRMQRDRAAPISPWTSRRARSACAGPGSGS